MVRGMRVGRLIPALSVCLAASVSLVAAQPKKGEPKKDDPKKAPVAPAPPAPAPAPAAPAPGGGGGGSAGGEVVQMTEDAPPGDIDGRDENPDKPRTLGDESKTSVNKPMRSTRKGYPIEEAMRPITLPQNMSEVGIGPHIQVKPVQGADALRARYGITSKVMLGLTYVLGGVFDDPASPNTTKIGVHTGKAVGLDVTVLLKDWIGVRLGVPVYIDPLAVGLTLGAPMKWQLAGGKYAIGALDDLLTIRLNRFAPSFYQEAANAGAAEGTRMGGTGTVQSKGSLRFSGYGVMQYQPKLAFIGRVGVTLEDFATTRTESGGGLSTFIRAGLQYTPRKYVDLGLSIGFDDMSKSGSFGPAGLLVFRI
jgi:hypothetical protein